ncbi:MAG: hypothetical protein ACRDRA_01230 [Pseudonocardiaceae bacterium]
MLDQASSGYPRQRTKVVRKIFITVLTGGTAYIFTNLLIESQVWGLAASVFIGGITLVIQFLSDVEGRLEKTEERLAAHSVEVQSLIERGFTKTNEIAELFQAVDASALQTDAITQLIRYSTQIRADSPPLVCGFAQLQINQTSRLLKELSERGGVSYDGEDRDWLLGLTMQSRHTIDATSIGMINADDEQFDGGLWTSDLGQRYLALQQDATRRNVIIRRVFIIDQSELIKQKNLLRICRQQAELGIRIKILNCLSDTIRGLLCEFVVFDSVVSYEVTPASQWRETVKTHLVLQPDQVRERMRRFEDLWGSPAREVD